MGDKTGIECTETPTSTHVAYRDIAGFSGYRVGCDGSVWSRWTYNGHQARRLGTEWRPMKPQPDGDGYLALSLYRDGRPHRRKVHLLALEAFVGARPDGMEGCHNDGVLTNCSSSNLRWDTPSANQRDRVAHGTDSRGTRNGNARLSEESVRAIRAALAAGATKKSLAVAHGVAASTIRAIANGRIWGWVAQA